VGKAQFVLYSKTIFETKKKTVVIQSIENENQSIEFFYQQHFQQIDF